MVEEKFSFRDARDIEHALKNESPLGDSRTAMAAAPSTGRARTMGDAQPFSVRADRNYSLDDFCCYEGSAFISAAYMGLLERRPDPAGARLYSSLLRSGTRKAMILSRLHYSTEGQKCKVRVRGLRIRYLFWRACQVPVIGHVLESGALLISLPRMSATIRRLEYICNSRWVDEQRDP